MKWTVEPIWRGDTCVILAGGPSLRAYDPHSLRRVLTGSAPSPRVISINDSWRLYPDADLCYFCDAAWWRDQVRYNRVSLDERFTFEAITRSRTWVKGGEDLEGDPCIRVLPFTGQMGFERSRSALRHGSNSGYQAIHLAAHLGARRIVLLGYDMRCDGSKTHWHDGTREPAAQFAATIAGNMLPCFETLVEPLRDLGIAVINATEGSALKCWPYQSIAEALQTTNGYRTPTGAAHFAASNEGEK